MRQKALTFVSCIAVVLLTISVSIGLPIYCRFFYYMQIDNLSIPEKTGYSKEDIRQAYDEVLNYLTLPNRQFGTGVFPHSAEGKDHFADCKFLFDLNFSILLSSALWLTVMYCLKRKGLFVPCRPFGKHYTFVSGISTLILFGLIGSLAATDFDRAFVVFHKLFFPGKDNWMFSMKKDPIIQALPETFFLRCGILILSSIVVLSLIFILTGIIGVRKQRRVPTAADSREE